MTKNGIISILFSAALLIGIMVCLICNIAISGNLTWSLIPAGSIVFAWAICFPSMILGKKGIIVSLISLSVLIIPYLFLLSILDKRKRSLFRWRSDCGGFRRFLVDHRRSFLPHGKNQEINRFRDCFLIIHPVYVCHQCHAGKNDRGARL